jgi:hypothetical protein
MKPIVRALRWTARHRRLMFLLGLTFGLVLLAHPGALADNVMGNISPAPQIPPGGWVGRYPVERYSLDQFFPAISVGVFSGVDASGVVPMIAYFGALILWEITCFLANGVILLFGLAFNLNLVTGNGTPGSGALAPVSLAIHTMYTSTFGTPWLTAMVALVGCWAMWKALVQRKYTETAGALGVSFLFFLLAIGIVTQPERTIGSASTLTNELSTATLSVTNEGSVTTEEKAKVEASNQLFELLVLNPWTVLEFGGLEHCAKVSHGKATSVAVRPLSSNAARDTELAAQLEHGTEVTTEVKTCINNRDKYATHFLQYPLESKERAAEHAALEHGDDEDLPESDSGKKSGTYPLGPADEPAAESMGKSGQYERLLLAIVILVGEFGAYLLLGALAAGVILAQILLLTLLAFAPVALLIGIFPGRGHEFFKNWLTKLCDYLARKVVYSIILAVVLAVCQALDDATSNLGWLLAFALQAAFLWTVFLQRNRLTKDLIGGIAGPRAAGDSTNRLANLYYASRLTRLMPSLPKLPKRSGGGSNSEPTASGNGPGGEPERGGEGEHGTPPPTGGAPGGGGSPSGGAPGEEELPPAGTGSPGPHETNPHGHGPGSPASTDEPDSDIRPADHAEPAHESREREHHDAAGSAAPPTVPTSGAPLRASDTDADELEPGERQGSPETSATAPPSSARPPATASPPAAQASSTTTPGAAGGSSATSTLPVTQTPPPPAPAAPRPQSPPTQPPAAGSVAPPSLPGAAPPDFHDNGAPAPSGAEPAAAPTPVAPAVPTDEPVEVLLRARQHHSPPDPATQEEDLA